MTAEGAPPTIDLARQADFVLGPLEVRPSRREAVCGGDRSVLEPRVMRVLVALALRRGEVVSRDELIACCWDGRIVGDDAINGCVAKVRRAGETSGAFAVETISRVGYRLLCGDPAPAMAAAPRAADEVVLAVLPFENLSGDADLAYFSDGVSEEILLTLAQRAGLRVIGRTSSFQFRGPDKTAAKVVAELGATHVLDGSVRRSGVRVRISAQLVEAATQTSVWADRFERDLSDIFALEDEIAGAVAQAMRTALAPAVRSGAVDPAAHELFLRGSVRPHRISRDASLARIAQLEEAVRRAPSFADAWGGLGLARAGMADFLPGAEAEPMRAAARAAAERALELDPHCAMAARAMVRILGRFGSLIELHSWAARALAWAPHDAEANRDYSRQLAAVGRNREALLAIRHAHRLDPLHLDTRAMLGRSLVENGELTEATRVLEEGLARWPEFELFPLWLMSAYGHAGRDDDVAGLMARYDLGARGREVRRFQDVLAAPEASREDAVQRTRRALERTGQVNFFTLALLAEIGEADAAFDIAARAQLTQPPQAADPMGLTGYNHAGLFMRPLPALRRDRRFVDFCGRLGLVDYWLTTGTWPDCVEEVAPYYDFKAECRRVAAELPGPG